jgi:hypothetical protein
MKKRPAAKKRLRPMQQTRLQAAPVLNPEGKKQSEKSEKIEKRGTAQAFRSQAPPSLQAREMQELRWSNAFNNHRRYYEQV